MKKMIPLLLLVALMTGCAAHTPPVEVAIPTAIPCPEPPLVVIPEDPVDKLTDGSTAGDAAKAYRISRIQWRRLALDLSNQLNAYRRH